VREKKKTSKYTFSQILLGNKKNEKPMICYLIENQETPQDKTLHQLIIIII